MSLFFYDGFDLNAYVTVGLASGNLDLSPNWGYGTPNDTTYTDGYLEGQAARVKHPAGGITRTVDAPAGGVVEYGFWATVDHTSIFDVDQVFLNVGGSVSGGGDLFYGIRIVPNVSNNPNIQLQRGTASTQIDGLNAALGNDVNIGWGEGIWKHFRIVAKAGDFKVYIDGSSTPSLSYTELGQGDWDDSVQIRIGMFGVRLADSTDFLIDHFYQTYDPLPTDKEILGVSIVAAQDRFDALAGFRGTLSFDNNETRYQNVLKQASISSKMPFGPNDRNYANCTHWWWFQDPRDGQDWTTQKLNEITDWGLCWDTNFDSEVGKKVRLTGACLSWLEYNNGTPIVKFEAPGAGTALNGPWQRTDPVKSFSAHIINVPRPDTLLRDDEDWLTCDNYGCFIMGRKPTPPLQTVGITFAEEYRTDYKDWFGLDGVGQSFDSFVVSGYGVYGDANKDFQSNYVTINYEVLSDGKAWVQGVWDYSLSNNSKRWSQKQEVYKQNDTANYKHDNRKLKIRGMGESLQLKISNNGDNPFKINGWSAYVTSNQKP